MKYFIFLCAILCAGLSFSQSKKKQIENLNRQIDSLELLVSSYSEMLDSCSENSSVQVKAVEQMNRENKLLREILKGYVKTIDELNTRLGEGQMTPPQDRVESGIQPPREVSKSKITVADEDVPLFFRNGSGAAGSRGEDLERRKVARSYDSYPSNDKRIQITKVDLLNIEIDQDAMIYYLLRIDAEGNVIGFTNYASKTTTTNHVLIARVGDALKKQLKYNKLPSSPLVYQDYTISVRAN